MLEPAYNIQPHIQKMIDSGSSGLDIMHGELKNLMYEAEKELEEAQRIEEENGYSDAMESMERKYWEGYTEALGAAYMLTYALSYAEGQVNARR